MKNLLKISTTLILLFFNLVSSISIYAQYNVGHKNTNEYSVSGSMNGHDYVDLGLPTKTLWATCNIGASEPYYSGNYYAWAESKTKNSYTEENSFSYKKEELRFGQFLTDIYKDGEFDAAFVEWGKPWGMPSYFDFQVLLEYTDISRVKINGREGILLTSKINGNKIFFPAAGSMLGSDLSRYGIYGIYWTCSAIPNDIFNSRCFWFSFQYYCQVNLLPEYRYSGCNIRPVFYK